MSDLSRRGFLAALPPPLSCPGGVAAAPRKHRLFFTSRGKTGLVNADGSGLRYFEFDKPGQATWQPAASLPRRPSRPLPEHGTPARRPRAAVRRVLHPDPDAPLDPRPRDRLAGGDLHQGSPGAVRDAGPPAGRSDRLLVQVVRKNVGQIFSVRLDGSDPREFTRAGEGLPYGLSLSPDGSRVAFHLAGPQGYQVWTSDVDGSNRVRVAAQAGAPLLRHELVAGRPLGPLRRLPARRRPRARLGRRLHRPARRRRAPGAHERQGDVVRGDLRRPEDAGRRVERARLDPRRLASSSLAACPAPGSPGNTSRNAPTSTTSTATSSPNSPGAAPRFVGSTRGRAHDRPHQERPAALGFPGERIAGRSTRGVLSREGRGSPRDLGHGRRRKEPSADHARDRRPRGGSSPVALSARGRQFVLGAMICEPDRPSFYPPILGDDRIAMSLAPSADDKGNLRFPLDQPYRTN